MAAGVRPEEFGSPAPDARKLPAATGSNFHPIACEETRHHMSISYARHDSIPFEHVAEITDAEFDQAADDALDLVARGRDTNRALGALGWISLFGLVAVIVLIGTAVTA